MTAGLPDRAADREREHDLKTWPEHFAAVLDGSKTYEIRMNDRGFRIGDVLRLREWDPIQVLHVTRDYRPRGYTGREVSRRVTHVLAAGTFGLRPGYVALGLAALAARPAPDDGEARCDPRTCPGHPVGDGVTSGGAIQHISDPYRSPAPSSPGSGDALHGKLAEALAAPFGRGNRYWAERAAAALLPVVRESIADELLWAATEAECHHDLVMLKRRAADALRDGTRA